MLWYELVTRNGESLHEMCDLYGEGISFEIICGTREACWVEHYLSREDGEEVERE